MNFDHILHYLPTELSNWLFVMNTLLQYSVLIVSEIARDSLQRTGKYNVIAGIVSPVSDGYKKKVSLFVI